MSFYVLFFWFCLPAVVVAAMRWGGTPERSAALLYLLAAIFTVAIRPAWPIRYHDVELGVFAIDLGLLIGLAVIAYKAELWWPIFATALQGISVLAHLAKALNPSFWRLAYAMMAGASSYPTLVLLVVGIWTNQRRMGSHHSPP